MLPTNAFWERRLLLIWHRSEHLLQAEQGILVSFIREPGAEAPDGQASMNSDQDSAAALFSMTVQLLGLLTCA